MARGCSGAARHTVLCWFLLRMSLQIAVWLIILCRLACLNFRCSVSVSHQDQIPVFFYLYRMAIFLSSSFCVPWTWRKGFRHFIDFSVFWLMILRALWPSYFFPRLLWPIMKRNKYCDFEDYMDLWWNWRHLWASGWWLPTWKGLVSSKWPSNLRADSNSLLIFFFISYLLDTFWFFTGCFPSWNIRCLHPHV